MSSRDGLPPASLPAGWGGDSPWSHGGFPALPGPDHGRHAPAAATGGLDVTALLKALRRHWVLALTLGVLCSSAVGFMVYKLMPASEYTARAQLLVEAEERGVLAEDSRLNSTDFRTLMKTQETLIKSPKVLGIVTGLKEIAPLPTIREHIDDPVTWLGDNLRVDFQGEVMNVSLNGSRPKDLALIVNAVVDTYLNKVVYDARYQRKTESELLQRVLNEKTKSLDAKRQQRASDAVNSGAPNQDLLNEKNKSVMDELNNAKKELWFATSELKKAEIEMELLRRQPDGGGVASGRIEEAVSQLVANDPEVNALTNQVSDLEDALEAASRNVRNPGRDANSRTIMRQIAGAKEDLEKARTRARSTAQTEAQNFVASNNASGGDMNDVKSRKDFYSNYSQYVTAQIESINSKLQEGTIQNNQLSTIDDEIARLEDVTKKMSERLNTLQVEIDAPSRVKPFQEALAPKSPDTKKRILATAASAMGTFGLVLLGISFLEYRVRRIDSPDVVSRGLGMRIVGALPATPNRSRFALPGRQGSALQEAYWRSRLNESVNAIRTLMLRHSQNERLQVVMVTSASVGEGKTSLSCHLATSLARAGRKTLLLDCDLRNPTAHRVFDLPLEPGMCEVLRGQVSLEEVSHPIALGDLRMITAGRCDLQALQALGMDQIGEVINRLRSQYEFIVVDTPPVLPVADPLLIGQHVDAALFSILRDVSRSPKVHTAAERLSSLGIRIFGAVVAGTPLETSGSEYYYTAAYVNAATTSDDDQENAS